MISLLNYKFSSLCRSYRVNVPKRRKLKRRKAYYHKTNISVSIFFYFNQDNIGHVLDILLQIMYWIYCFSLVWSCIGYIALVGMIMHWIYCFSRVGPYIMFWIYCFSLDDVLDILLQLGLGRIFDQQDIIRYCSTRYRITWL